ncbi:hypothetical protein ACLOJK_008788 [Asimina triloba]
MGIRESTTGHVALPDVRIEFIEPFQYLVSSFSIQFALTSVELDDPNDIDLLLNLCSILKFMEEQAGVELDGLSKTTASSPSEKLLQDVRDWVAQIKQERDELSSFLVEIGHQFDREATTVELVAQMATCESAQEERLTILEEYDTNLLSLESFLPSVREDHRHMEEAIARVPSGHSKRFYSIL